MGPAPFGGNCEKRPLSGGEISWDRELQSLRGERSSWIGAAKTGVQPHGG